jgi:hypothetical protein
MGDVIAGQLDTRYPPDTVEARLGLDLRRVRRLHVLERPCVLTWVDEAGRPLARIATSPAVGGLRAAFSVGKAHLAVSITLASTPCPFGGKRPWFLCAGCAGRRVCLYFEDARFLCRRCLGLTYATERAGSLQRKLLRADSRSGKLARAGGSRGKPPRMTWARYLELRLAAENAELSAQAEFRAVALRLRGEANELLRRSAPPAVGGDDHHP